MGRLSQFINGGGFGITVDESVVELNVKNIENMTRNTQYYFF